MVVREDVGISITLLQLKIKTIFIPGLAVITCNRTIKIDSL
jgi:hypothetical protein